VFIAYATFLAQHGVQTRVRVQPACCRPHPDTPTHRPRQVTVAKQTLQDDRRHFDVVVACEDEESGEDLDVPLVSIRYK
jgi:hypothetical protein